MIMKTLTDAFSALRKKNRKNYTLYFVCNFTALLLITAYSAILTSPTVLLVLPEGGDSRKQAMMIFALACVGCVIFTIYAGNIFFRMKSRELGIFLALGTSKKVLRNHLYKDTAVTSLSASLLGTALGIPFAWSIWQLFRLLVVDSDEMHLVLDVRCLLIPAAFVLIILFFAFLLGRRTLYRTNIMDVVNEEHKNEPVRDVKPWYASVGILLMIFGGTAGYFGPAIYQVVFRRFSSPFLPLLYIPLFIGLYMFLLHVVVRGFGSHKKHPYKGIISRSMMKFQGKQTVNNMMVIALLVAGGAFALFYIPTLQVGQAIQVKATPYDYSFHYPVGQPVPGKEEIADLAKDYDLSIKDYKEEATILLGMSTTVERTTDDGKLYTVYEEFANEGTFLTASAFEFLTGQKTEVAPGTYKAVSNEDETDTYWLTSGADQIINMTTMEKLPVTFDGYLHYSLFSGRSNYYVLNDADYEKMAVGLGDEWKEHQVLFNIDGEDNYEFADKLFHVFMDALGEKFAISFGYDRVVKYGRSVDGESYYLDEPEYAAAAKVDYEDCDGSNFRFGWKYMPSFKMLDSTDFVRTTAVYLMLFLFITIICVMAALIICYTRSISIVLNNRYVFEDLKRLGASPAFLTKEVKAQARKIFFTPSIIGMVAMYLFFSMILYANDGTISYTEIASLLVCLALLFVLFLIIWIVYNTTIRKMKQMLGIEDNENANQVM